MQAIAGAGDANAVQIANTYTDNVAAETLAAANDSAVTDQGKPITIAVLGNDAAQAGPGC